MTETESKPSHAGAATTRRAPRWIDALVVILVVVIGYGIGSTRIPLHGEETCRALHGIEMAESGDWLVATNQHQPILDRPPLHYWLLASIHRHVHELDPLTLRLSMALATMLMALTIWWCAGRVLSRGPALVAAIAYPTIGHVFDLGLRAETDGVYALFLGVAWLVWHAGYVLGDRPWSTWLPGCAIGALATLTKGLQGAVSFYGAIGLFLLVRRDWRMLFHPAQFAGFGLFTALIAIWNIPFYLATGWEGSRETWIDPLTLRVDDAIDALTAAARLLRFPLTVFGAALPWSALLLTLPFRPLRGMSPPHRSTAQFALIGMFVVFAPVWISEGGLRRHVMGMYPLLAVFSGVVAERVASADCPLAVRRIWTWTIRAVGLSVGGLVAVVTLATVAAGRFDNSEFGALAQPLWLLVALISTVVILLPRLWRDAAGAGGRAVGHGAAVAALLVAAAYNGPITEAKSHDVVDVPAQVAALRERLPQNVTLYSFGMTHHRFVYWYRDAIPVVPMPKSAADVPAALEYFVITTRNGVPAELPFDWSPVAVVNLDRKQSDDPVDGVLIGRRSR